MVWPYPSSETLKLSGQSYINTVEPLDVLNLKARLYQEYW